MNPPPLLAVNPMHDRRIGTVGVAAKGVEIRIAEDGEIIARGGIYYARLLEEQKSDHLSRS